MGNLKRGDMVACLKTPGTPAYWRTGQLENGAKKWPVVNGVYTVRAVTPATYSDGPGLLLEEIHNRPVPYDDGTIAEPEFHPCNFRKIRTPDISALRKIVTKAFDGAERKASKKGAAKKQEARHAKV